MNVEHSAFDVYKDDVNKRCRSKCEELKNECTEYCNKNKECLRKCHNVYANCSNVCLLWKENKDGKGVLPIEMNIPETETAMTEECPSVFSWKLFLFYLSPVLLATLVFYIKEKTRKE